MADLPPMGEMGSLQEAQNNAGLGDGTSVVLDAFQPGSVLGVPPPPPVKLDQGLPQGGNQNQQVAANVDAAASGEGQHQNKNGNSKAVRSQSSSVRKVPAFAEGRKMLAVAAASPVKQVAGSIAHTSRETEPPVLSAVGPASVNQAIKAIAIARSYLEKDGIELKVEASRGDVGSDIKDLIVLNLIKFPLVKEEQEEEEKKDFQNLKSAGKSSTSQLAGAVAKNIRELKNVKITAVGQNPVFRAVDSVVYARRYLSNDGYDLEFQPKFTRLEFANGFMTNAMQLTVLAKPI